MTMMVKPPVIVLLLTTLGFSSLPSSSEAATDMTESQLRQTEIREEEERDILSVVCSLESGEWRHRAEERGERTKSAGSHGVSPPPGAR